MNPTNLPTRFLAAGLPLIIIAIVFGALGYALTQTKTRPVPPLPPVAQHVAGTHGVVQSVQGDSITLTTDDGHTQSFKLQPGFTVEALRPATLSDLQTGDWINGGAISHDQSVLALTGLVEIANPVLPP